MSLQHFHFEVRAFIDFDVGDKLAMGHRDLVSSDDHIRHVLEIQDGRLDLFGGDPKSAHLNLVIETPERFDSTVEMESDAFTRLEKTKILLPDGSDKHFG